MSQCKRCFIDSRLPDVEIDSTGVCTFCTVSEKHSDLIEKIGHQEHLLKERIDRFRGVGEYDCVVGLSGGKDSSYILLRLVRHYGARVYTYTFDNGFMTDYALDNIERIVRDIGVEHEWVKIDHDVLKSAYMTSLLSDGWQCSACFYLGHATTWKVAVDKKIPFAITGRAPEQILRTPRPEDFESPYSLIPENMAPYDPKRVAEAANHHASVMKSLGEWLISDKSLHKAASETLYWPQEEKPFTEEFAPELISLFLYEVHDEKRIKDTLTSETSWQRPEDNSILSHADCATHDAAGYLYHSLRGVPFLGLEVASCIRQGKISKEIGEERLKQEVDHVSGYPAESMSILAAACDKTDKQLMRAMKRNKLMRPIKKLAKKFV